MSNKIPVYQKALTIAWGDMDALNHVNNSRYFDYFQEARIEWLHELGLNMTSEKGPVVIQVACTFLRPVVYPAHLTLKNSIHSLGRSSVIMDHDLYQNDVLMAEGMSKIVWVDYQQNKSVLLPSEIRDLFL